MPLSSFPSQATSAPMSLPATTPVAPTGTPFSLPGIGGGLSGGAPAPIHDIVGPLPFFPYTPLEVFLFFLSLGALLFLLFFFWRRYRRRGLTPRQLALKELAVLRQKLMEGTDHEFGILVSSLLRRYLEGMFGLAAPRQTTEEFLISLKANPSFSQEEQASLSHFLHQSDLLKFAGEAAGSAERQNLLAAAEQFLYKREEEKTSSTEKS